MHYDVRLQYTRDLEGSKAPEKLKRLDAWIYQKSRKAPSVMEVWHFIAALARFLGRWTEVEFGHHRPSAGSHGGETFTGFCRRGWPKGYR